MLGEGKNNKLINNNGIGWQLSLACCVVLFTFTNNSSPAPSKKKSWITTCYVMTLSLIDSQLFFLHTGVDAVKCVIISNMSGNFAPSRQNNGSEKKV